MRDAVTTPSPGFRLCWLRLQVRALCCSGIGLMGCVLEVCTHVPCSYRACSVSARWQFRDRSVVAW